MILSIPLLIYIFLPDTFCRIDPWANEHHIKEVEKGLMEKKTNKQKCVAHHHHHPRSSKSSSSNCSNVEQQQT